MAQHFIEQIRSGQLKPGDRLPSFRQLREQFGATPSTVERLHAQLARKNLIERRHRSGVFVAAQNTSTLQGILGFVSLCFNSPQLHPYNHLLLQGIQQEAHAADQQILLLAYNDVAAKRDKVDGLLIYERELGKFLPFQKDLPCVSLIQQTGEMSSVVADDFGGGKAAARHLLELGHRRIACLMGTAHDDIHDPLGELRLQGYRAALREVGIIPNPQWARPLMYNPFENSVERGYSQMRAWLEENWRELGCTAIFAQNDEIAIGVIQALQEAGLRVPRDVSVVGFDGAGVDAHFLPRLTTIEVPLEEISRQATQILLRRIAGDTSVEHIVLPAPLRAGQSSATPRVLPAH